VRRLLALGLGALIVAAAGCGHERPHQVKLGIEQIGSIGSEASLLADDVARGRTKTTFVRVHGEELSAQAQHEAEKLNDDPVAASMRRTIRQAIQLAASIGGAIDELRTSPEDRGQARANARKLARWAGQARRLADSL
jgi:hypothetical protein